MTQAYNAIIATITTASDASSVTKSMVKSTTWREGNGSEYGVASHYVDLDRWNGSSDDILAYFGLTDAPAPEPPLERKVEMLWDAHPELHGEL